MRVRTRFRDAARFAAYRVGVRNATHVRPWPTGTWNDDWQAGIWDYMAETAEAPRYALLAGLILSQGSPGTVLDIGCGSGTLRRHLHPDSFTSYRGVDIAPSAIERAATVGYERSTFACADASTEPKDPAETVVLNEVAYLVADPMTFIADVGRLVVPGGRLIASIYRHPGDIVHWRALDRVGHATERIWVRNRNPSAPYGTRIVSYRMP